MSPFQPVPFIVPTPKKKEPSLPPPPRSKPNFRICRSPEDLERHSRIPGASWIDLTTKDKCDDFFLRLAESRQAGQSLEDFYASFGVQYREPTKPKKVYHHHQPRKRQRMWEADPYCHYCGVKLDLDEATLDHMVPRSKGGSNGVNNLVICCRPCNGQKGVIPYDVFKASRFVQNRRKKLGTDK